MLFHHMLFHTVCGDYFNTLSKTQNKAPFMHSVAYFVDKKFNVLDKGSVYCWKNWFLDCKVEKKNCLVCHVKVNDL